MPPHRAQRPAIYRLILREAGWLTAVGILLPRERFYMIHPPSMMLVVPVVNADSSLPR